MPPNYFSRRFVHTTIDAMMPNFTFSKVLTEGMIGTDTVAKASQRTLTEGLIGTDIFAGVRTKVTALVTEGLIGTDTIIKSIVRLLTEGIIGTDSVKKTNQRSLSEGLIGTDSISFVKAFGRTLTEGLIQRDTLRMLKNGTDVIWTHITKSASAVFSKIQKASTGWTHINRN